MTEMPTPQAKRFLNVREGFDMPHSRYGSDHAVAEVIIDADTELEPSHDVTPRQVGGPALTGAEFFTAA